MAADPTVVKDLMGVGFSPFQASYLGNLLSDSTAPLPITSGGTGQITAAAALHALAPIMTYAASGNVITAQVAAVGDTALAIKAMAAQTGDLQRWLDSSAAELMCVTATGTLIWGNDSGLSRLATGSMALGNGTSGDFTGLLKLKNIYVSEGTVLLHTVTSLSTAAATGSAATLLNAPVSGNPTKWIPIDDNSTTRYIPSW
jgi:hypothetical protein